MSGTAKRRIILIVFAGLSMTGFGFLFNSIMTPDIFRSTDPENGIGYVYVHDDDQKVGRQQLMQVECWSFDSSNPVESVVLRIVPPGASEPAILPLARTPDTSVWIAPIGLKKRGVLLDNFSGNEIKVSDRYLYVVEAASRSGKKALIQPERNWLERIMGWAPDKKFKLTFEGEVSRCWLIAHIVLMVAAPVFLLHALYYAVLILAGSGDPLRKLKTSLIAGWVCFTASSIPIGIIITSQAFNVGFEPWPFGGDITDTKSLFLVLLWAVVFAVLWKRGEKAWSITVISASVLSAAVYMIPHSMIVQ